MRKLRAILGVEQLEERCTPSTTWTGATSTDWNTATNWSNGVPNGAAAVALFGPQSAGTVFPTIGMGDNITVSQLTTSNWNVSNTPGTLTVSGGGMLTISGNGVTSVLNGSSHLVIGGNSTVSVTSGAILKMDATSTSDSTSLAGTANNVGTLYVTGTGSDVQFLGSGTVKASIVVGKTMMGTATGTGELDFLPNNGAAFTFSDSAELTAYGAAGNNGLIKLVQPTSPTSSCGIEETTGSAITLRSGGTYTIVASVAGTSSTTIHSLPVFINSYDAGTVNVSGYVVFFVDTNDAGKYAMHLSGGQLNMQLTSGSGATVTFTNTTSANIAVDGNASATFYAAGTADSTVYTYTVYPNFTFMSGGTLLLGSAQSWVNFNEISTFRMESGTLSFHTYYDGSNLYGDWISANKIYFDDLDGSSATWSVYSNDWGTYADPYLVLVASTDWSGGAVGVSSTTGGWTPTGGWNASYDAVDGDWTLSH